MAFFPASLGKVRVEARAGLMRASLENERGAPLAGTP